MEKVNKKICPCCGSSNIEEKKEIIKRKIINDYMIEFEGVNNICSSCKEEGDFFGKNDALFAVAKTKKDKKYFESILKTVSKNNSFAYIERVLGLPQRTLTRWKKKGASSSGITLMKFIETYPWMLKVADKNFDQSYARKELIQQAAISLSGITTDQDWYISADIKKGLQEESYIILTCKAVSTKAAENSENFDHPCDIISQDKQIGDIQWVQPIVA